MAAMSDSPDTNEIETGWDRLRSERLNKYELVALELFATRGFDHVSVEDIALEVGVSSRTLYRYFPTKEDFLLGYIRRSVFAVAESISALPIADSPFEAVWNAINQHVVDEPEGVKVMNLWRAAARTAPNVSATAIGERSLVMIEELVDYFAKCWNVDPDHDPNPRLAAGLIVGLEFAMSLAVGRTDMSRESFTSSLRFDPDGVSLKKSPRRR